MDDLLKEQEVQLLEEASQSSQNKTTGNYSAETFTLRRELIRKLKLAQVSGRVIIKLDKSEVKDFKNSKYDLVVDVGDTLTIPRRNETIAVLGEVYNPNSLVWVEGKEVSYYLTKVGGYTNGADNENMFIVKADGSVLSQQHNDGILFGTFYGHELEPGDTILVPRDLSPVVDVLGITSQVTQVLFNLATTTGVINTLF